MYKYFRAHEIRGLKPKLVDMLDVARELAGIPFVITSGKRSYKENKEVGGVEESSHLTGEAVDIRARNNEEHFVITQGLMMAGFTRISRSYPKHVHVDVDIDKPQPCLF